MHPILAKMPTQAPQQLTLESQDMKAHERYMRRALQLARKGAPWAFPNPMVGAVITDPSGAIIGEGYHRKCGEAHAEVNAIASVADEKLLADSTMYVTLEPCAHTGRTGPCARLIIDKKIPRVVVGTRDPFDKVDGKGIEMLREAGVEVTVGVLEDECRRLNAAFFTAHTLKRPFVTLKWAQSADRYLSTSDQTEGDPVKISTPLTTTLMHRQRAMHNAILIGSETALVDNPRLDNRRWPGESPVPIVLDRRGRIGGESRLMQRDPLIIKQYTDLHALLHQLYEQNISTIMVEGGAQVLRSFVEAGLWDIIRVETAEKKFSDKGKAKAPVIGDYIPIREIKIGQSTVKYYSNNELVDVKNL